MGEVSIAMTMEEDEITLHQNDGLLEFGDKSGVPLLDMADESDFPCKLGIEATDMGSLLEQFEEGKINGIFNFNYGAILTMVTLPYFEDFLIC